MASDGSPEGWDWICVIEQEIDDPELAQRLIDDLRMMIVTLRQLVGHWKLKDRPEQSVAQARDELKRLRRALHRAHELVTDLGSTAQHGVMHEAFRQLPNAWYYSESELDIQNPVDEIAKMISAYVRIVEESANSMAVRASRSARRDEITDFVIQTIAVVFQKADENIALSQLSTSLFHRVTSMVLGVLEIDEGNLRRSISRLNKEDRLQT